MGASGIVSPIAIQPTETWNSQRWKYIFVASFTAAANGYLLFVDNQAIPDSELKYALSKLGYVIVGLLVGFGTKLGNGCTSGHGICGLARFSRRSLAAVVTFMTTAIITASLLPENFLKSNPVIPTKLPSFTSSVQNDVLVIAATVAAVAIGSSLKNKQPLHKMIGASISGFLFATGLAVSGMILPSKVVGFLDVSNIASSGSYDPTLACVMAGGVLVSLLGYQYKNIFRNVKPILAEEYNVPCNTIIDSRLLIGASCFGLGWGIGGLCPGPAMFHATTGNTSVLYYWMPSFFIGSYIASKVQQLYPTPCSIPPTSTVRQS